MGIISRVEWMMIPKCRLFCRLSSNYITVSQDKCLKAPNAIAKHLKTRIKVCGPISIAEYMREILTHPQGGYYMHRDVLGASGDFITSPELGQVFGELIAIWFLNEWSKAGAPKPLNLVELGPGRGTLCHDILRVFQYFRMLDSTEVHLVEISPLMSELQAKKLCVESHLASEADAESYRFGRTMDGVSIKWHKHLSDVPKHVFTLFIAQEFFDALPVHKFHKTINGYRELLIDINDDVKLGEPEFRFVLAKDHTPPSKLYIKPDEMREHVEISPESLVLVKDIAKRVECDGGLALIADYGHNGDGTDTFRAFKQHQLYNPLMEPGTADLTADVDFAALKRTAQEIDGVYVYGPVKQGDFLLKMGIEHRIQILEENAKDEEQRQGLRRGFNMMMDSDQMGSRYKFISIVPSSMEKIYSKHPVIGFH